MLAVATPSSEVAVSTPLSLTLMSTRMPAASRRLIATWRIALSHRALLMLSILTMVTSTFRHTGCRRNSHLEGRLFAGVEFGYSHGQRHGRGHSTRTDRGDTFKRLAVASIKKVKESIKNVKGQGWIIWMHFEYYTVNLQNMNTNLNIALESRIDPYL